MKAAAAVAEILKREGVEFLIGYPVNPIIEAAAEADIRTIIVRQERTGLHMADAVSRITSGERVGVFAMQHGPGTENAFGGVAQAYGDSVPIVVLPGGYPRRITNIPPNFNAFLNFQHVTKWCEQVIVADAVPDAMRRAFTQVKNGRPRPVLVEFPVDVLREDVPEPIDYTPAPRLAVGARSARRVEGGRVLVAAERPVIYAGQGVHYAQGVAAAARAGRAARGAGDHEPPGQERVPREPPARRSARAGARSRSRSTTSCTNADLIFGIGCSFATTNYGVAMPKGKRSSTPPSTRPTSTRTSRATRPGRRRRPRRCDAVLAEVRDRLKGGPRGRLAAVAQEIKNAQGEWLAEWMPRLTAGHDAALAVPGDLGPDAHGRRREHDHHPRRRQPARPALAVLGADGAAHLHRLGQDDPARLRARAWRWAPSWPQPDKLCINVWGDAAIGFTGMDFETAVRERIPILSVLLNNFSMAIELKVMKAATEKYRAPTSAATTPPWPGRSAATASA